MYFYSVYRYRSRSGWTFARVGSILGYKGLDGSRTYSSLRQEAKRLFAAGDEDVILLGPSPIAILARTLPSPGNDDPAASPIRGEWSIEEGTGIDCS
jgi:hypothetical protein